jgi:hypothetical protein
VSETQPAERSGSMSRSLSPEVCEHSQRSFHGLGRSASAPSATPASQGFGADRIDWQSRGQSRRPLQRAPPGMRVGAGRRINLRGSVHRGRLALRRKGRWRWISLPRRLVVTAEKWAEAGSVLGGRVLPSRT